MVDADRDACNGKVEGPGWFQVSNVIFDVIRVKKLSRDALIVYLFLRSVWDRHTGGASRGLKYIGQKTGLDRGSVSRALTELRTRRLIATAANRSMYSTAIYNLPPADVSCLFGVAPALHEGAVEARRRSDEKRAGAAPQNRAGAFSGVAPAQHLTAWERAKVVVGELKMRT